MLPLAPLALAAVHTLQDRAETLARFRDTAKPPSAGRVPPGGFDRTFDATGLAPLPAEVVSSPRPEVYLPRAAVPSEWDWRDVAVGNNTLGLPATMSYTAEVRNQAIPEFCGCCWAHAAAAVMGARRRIHGADPAPSSTEISVQHLVNCVGGQHAKVPKCPCTNGRCGGGSAYDAFAYAHTDGAVDNSCLAYTATTNQCTAVNICQQHLGGGPVASVAPVRYFVGEYGTVPDEPAMLKEIYARGPIACCMALDGTGELMKYTGGVYSTPVDKTDCEHVVAMVGFGGTGSDAYWLVQNSFGAAWGLKGFFKIKRSSALQSGEHNCGIETMCSWSMPK